MAFYTSDWDIYTAQLSHINPKSHNPWKSLGGLWTEELLVLEQMGIFCT